MRNHRRHVRRGVPGVALRSYPANFRGDHGRATGWPRVAVILAVIAANFGGDGWESNPPRTPQQRPANGFEDRGPTVRKCPSTSDGVRSLARTFHDHPPTSAVV